MSRTSCGSPSVNECCEPSIRRDGGVGQVLLVAAQVGGRNLRVVAAVVQEDRRIRQAGGEVIRQCKAGEVRAPERNRYQEDGGDRTLIGPLGEVLQQDRSTERVANQQDVVAQAGQLLLDLVPPEPVVRVVRLRHGRSDDAEVVTQLAIEVVGQLTAALRVARVACAVNEEDVATGHVTSASRSIRANSPCSPRSTAAACSRDMVSGSGARFEPHGLRDIHFRA